MILLALHILFGGISLISGGVVMLLKKGDHKHRLIGKIYFYALTLACLCAIPMCYIHLNLFLFMVSLFTMYMLLSGWRYLRIRDISDFNRIDHLYLGILVLSGLVLCIWGVLLIFQSKNFGIVLITLGGFCLNFGLQDYFTMKGKSKYLNFGLVRHIQRMAGSYISSMTAFVVVNNTWLPGALAWLLPSLILVPLIVRWSRVRGRLSNKFVSQTSDI
jgi:uncharacterized membrane protein